MDAHQQMMMSISSSSAWHIFIGPTYHHSMLARRRVHIRIVCRTKHPAFMTYHMLISIMILLHMMMSVSSARIYKRIYILCSMLSVCYNCSQYINTLYRYKFLAAIDVGVGLPALFAPDDGSSSSSSSGSWPGLAPGSWLLAWPRTVLVQVRVLP